ncbi:MAG TPA: Uma2 family endonuclease [Vicinamibacterales bacterium]
MTLEAYLTGEETMRPQELAYGVLREPPAPGFHHQIVVGRIHSRLERHVDRFKAGRVVLSPIDVILDRERALVVQPDIVFISTARLGICTDRIWGAPDLAIEVLSKSNRRHDCTVKVKWYRQYGVRECWLVDPRSCRIEVVDLTGPKDASHAFAGRQIVRSAVLPSLRLRPAAVLDD